MRRKRFLALVLSLTLAVGPAITVMAEKDAAQTESGGEETNEEVATESVQDGTRADVENNAVVGGYIPSELDNNTPVYKPKITTYANDVLESKYPANGVSDIEAKYPAIRNQNPYGTCWAFSSMGLAEFDLINDGTAQKDIDLSELQLIYYTYNSVTDPLGGTEGDSSKYYVENSGIKNGYLDRGGNYIMASRRLGQWVGAVNESDVPYSKAQDVLKNGLEDEYAYSHDVGHLENTYLINIKQNPEEVKEQIKEHGAAGVMYSHCDTGYHYINNNYCDISGMTGGGHAVMVVGWDDNYSKDNFRDGVKPSRDGAWLIRNSWGVSNSYNNNCEYFWMSYDTYSLGDTAWIFDFEKNDGYDNNYQVDGGLNVGTLGSYSKVANIFTTQNTDGISSEDLKAVSLSFTSKTNISYTIDIYTDLTSDTDPFSGTKQEVATTTGTTTYAGVYTIPLNSVINLKPGTNFSVVVTTNEPAMDFEYVELNEVNENKEPVWDVAVSSFNHKSYHCNNYGNAWEDPYGYNYCIKAFTSNNPTESNLGDKLYGRSLTLNGSTDVNFYMELPENIVKNENAYMEFTTEDGTIHDVGIKDAQQKKDGDKTYYVFKCPVYAMEMTDQITAQMVVDGQRGEAYTYSIKQYADQVLKGEKTYSDATKNLVKALLNYGSAAQVQFEYKTDTLANAELNDNDKIIKETDFKSYIKSASVDEKVKGISCYGTTLVLNAETAIRHYFQIEPGYNIGNYTFNYTDSEGNSKNLEPKQKSGSSDLYYVEIPDIKAYELNQMPTLTVHSNDMADGEGIKITYGPFSYCYNVKNSQSTKNSLKNVADTLYWYWYYANEYVKTQGY